MRAGPASRIQDPLAPAGPQQLPRVPPIERDERVRCLIVALGPPVVSVTNFRSLHPLAHESPPARPCSCRSWTRANDSCAVSAAMSAVNMSHCVSHGSPCVARNASAPDLRMTAAAHSKSSYEALIARQTAVTTKNNHLPGANAAMKAATRDDIAAVHASG